jgi:hypothetical protein
MDPGILVPLTLFGGAAAVLWKYFEGRHKERMAMIEKGVNPAEFKSTNPMINPLRLLQSNVLSNLKWGLLLVFAGIGLLVGHQLQYYFGFHEETAIFGSILIAGGLALLIFYLIAAKKLKEKKENER